MGTLPGLSLTSLRQMLASRWWKKWEMGDQDTLWLLKKKKKKKNLPGRETICENLSKIFIFLLFIIKCEMWS